MEVPKESPLNQSLDKIIYNTNSKDLTPFFRLDTGELGDRMTPPFQDVQMACTDAELMQQMKQEQAARCILS